MDGLDPFVTTLDGIGRETAKAGSTTEAPAGDRPDLDPADPVHQPFELLLERGNEARITFDNGTLRQSWRGRVEALKPSMGFLNVMTPDFHLHMKGGSFSGWRSSPGQRIALDDQGNPNGLVVAAECFI